MVMAVFLLSSSLSEVGTAGTGGEYSRVNRCFAFVATISRSSGKVTFCERMRGQESFCRSDGASLGEEIAKAIPIDVTVEKVRDRFRFLGRQGFDGRVEEIKNTVTVQLDLVCKKSATIYFHQTI